MKCKNCGREYNDCNGRCVDFHGVPHSKPASVPSPRSATTSSQVSSSASAYRMSDGAELHLSNMLSSPDDYSPGRFYTEMARTIVALRSALQEARDERDGLRKDYDDLWEERTRLRDGFFFMADAVQQRKEWTTECSDVWERTTLAIGTREHRAESKT